MSVFVLVPFVVAFIPEFFFFFFLPDSMKELLSFHKEIVFYYKHGRDVFVVVNSMDFE